MLCVMARCYMPVKFERRIFTAGGSLRVNLPSPFTNALNLKKGDLVTITLTDSQMVIEKSRKK
jgi:antitoxin component of MazEF toxin-antitoxin module